MSKDTIEERMDRWGQEGPFNRPRGPKSLLKSQGLWTPRAKRRVFVSRFVKVARVALVMLAFVAWSPAFAEPPPTPATGKPAITAPAVRSIAVGERVQVDLSFAGADFIDWRVLGCDYEADRLYSADPQKISLKFSATVPGMYYIVSSASNKQGITVAVVTLSVRPYVPPGPMPPPPIPPPNPDPPKPDPPKPPPVPVDPLADALAKAWALESASDKTHVKDLAALYRQSVQLAAAPTITTAGQLHDVMKAARVALVGEALPGVRAVITGELNRTLPTAVSAPLDAATRKLCGDTFLRVATALEGLK